MTESKLNLPNLANTSQENLTDITLTNKQTFYISLFTFIILCYFFIGYIKNLLFIFKDYYHKDLIVNKVNQTIKNDNNYYDMDNIYYESNRNEILKSIKNMKNSHTDEFAKLKQFKENTNQEYLDKGKSNKLDTNLYSEVNSKVLANKHDNYKYNNPPSIIEFIFDIFQPTKA